MPSLFARLRPAPPPSSAAYDAAVNVARAPHWYREGQVPDTMDGRFAVLATVLALVNLRMEELGSAGNAAAVALTEAFIADMDAQMRQAGFGDPSLGKQVRSLVGSLASRVDRWRTLLTDGGDWHAAVSTALYREAYGTAEDLAHSVAALKTFERTLFEAEPTAILEGRW